jgi:hypothetical protein
MSVMFIRFSTNYCQMDVMMSIDYNMMDNIPLIQHHNTIICG